MKILVVVSGNNLNGIPFVEEQISSLTKYNCEFLVFKIKGKGTLGYLSNLKNLKNTIKIFQPDLIHAHYGLSGLLANLQRKVPVITTFHGSDINNKKILKFSILAHKLSKASIFVEDKMATKLSKKTNQFIIPCGINTDLFAPVDKKDARKILSLNSEDKLILFSSSFNNTVKNYPLAAIAISKLDRKVNLIELKNKTRKEVALLLNAVDLLLLTSHSEGSPQIVKEAMACNCPVVSTNVGDVGKIISNTQGCYLSSYDHNELAARIKDVLTVGKRTNGREFIKEYDIDNIASKINKIYLQFKQPYSH